MEAHHLKDQKEEDESKKILQVLNLNAALTSSKLSKPKDVIHFTNNVLHINRGSAKAYYLKGKVGVDHNNRVCIQGGRHPYGALRSFYYSILTPYWWQSHSSAIYLFKMVDINKVFFFLFVQQKHV